MFGSMIRYFSTKPKPKMKPIELKTLPEQTQTITRVIFDILKEHGPLTVGDTWERVKEVGLRGLTSKRHMKIVLRWMRERQKIRLICNHVGPHKQFLYTTWFTKPSISHTRAVHNSSTSTTIFSVHTSSSKLSSDCQKWSGSLPTHIEKFYEVIGLEVQNGYGLTETSPCISGRQPYYNVYNSLFHSVFEINRYGSVCFFLVALLEIDFSGIQKQISSSPSAIK